MCEKLHFDNEGEKIYKNMTAWFYYDKDGKKICTDGSEHSYYNSIYDEWKFKKEKPFLIRTKGFVNIIWYLPSALK